MAKPKKILTDNEKKMILAFWEIGKTDEQIAKVIELPTRTFIDVCKYNGLTTAIKNQHKDTANMRVEKSLFNKALSGELGAQIFWLCNRDPERWQNTQKVDHSGQVNSNITFVVQDLKKTNGDGK